MNYSALVASKGTAGAIATWSNYSKLDTATVLDEAQSLLWSVGLRCREMRSEWIFGMAVGQANIALPTGFLDPIGRLYDITNSIFYRHKIETDIQSYRAYDSSPAGSFGANPFTTGAGTPYGSSVSSYVTVVMAAHGLNQDSTITIAAATTVDGINMNGTFPVVSITDANDFVVDSGQVPTVGGVTGGGSAATWTANKLTSASPSVWTIWNEQVKFDTAFDTATTFKQLYFKAPGLLSAANPTNFLTNRYPFLIRKATMCAAADFMKDTEEYNKELTALTTMIQAIAAENDMMYRGAEIETDTPGGNSYSGGYY